MDTPRTPEEYRRALFNATDRAHFAPYERMVERNAYYTGQAQKFGQRVRSLEAAAERARQKFYASLSDEDYQALVAAVAAHKREADLRAGFPQFDTLLGSTFAPACMSAEFPNAVDEMVGVVDFMVSRYTQEADRVRPLEEKRLADADAALADFGAAEAPAPVDERSPVLRDLKRTIAALNKIREQLDTGETTYRSVGFHAAPIVAALKAQKDS